MLGYRENHFSIPTLQVMPHRAGEAGRGIYLLILHLSEV
jgi:hypothetical protein